MRKIFTLTYIIKTYQKNKTKEEIFSEELISDFNDEMYEPAPESVNVILNFAKSYNVLHSENTGNIELNLN